MKKTSLSIVESEIVDIVSLTDLCRWCGVSADWVIELVDHGILDPIGSSTQDWEFHGQCLVRVVKAARLTRDMGINIAGIALVLDLLEERDRLARQLAQRDGTD